MPAWISAAEDSLAEGLMRRGWGICHRTRQVSKWLPESTQVELRNGRAGERRMIPCQYSAGSAASSSSYRPSCGSFQRQPMGSVAYMCI
jgi:hypothetical protein